MALDFIRDILNAYPHHLDKFDIYRGRIISLWALIESGIDQANHYAWRYSGMTLAEKVPVSLNRKIKLFKEANRDLLPFEPLRERAAELIANVDALYEARHWLVHGYIIPEECGKRDWVLGRHYFPKETRGLVTVKHTYVEDDLRELRSVLLELTQDFGRYLYALADQVEKHGVGDKPS